MVRSLITQKKLTIFFTTWWHALTFDHWNTVKRFYKSCNFFSLLGMICDHSKKLTFFFLPGLSFDHQKKVDIFSDFRHIIFWSLKRSWHSDHYLIWYLITGIQLKDFIKICHFFFTTLYDLWSLKKSWQFFSTTWSDFWSLENSWQFFWFMRYYLLITKKELT